MPKSKKMALQRYAEKPRIVVQVHSSDEVHDEIFRLAKEWGWKIFNLYIDRSILPENPVPIGAIITSSAGSDEILHQGRVFPFPTVHVGLTGEPYKSPYPKVHVDLYSAGQMAVDYFVDAGFKNILLATVVDWEKVTDVNKGAAARIEERGCNLHLFRFTKRQGEDMQTRRRRHTQELGDYLLTLPRPLAYIANNDYIAARFCFTCESVGLSVPEDVAVMGVENRRSICKGSLAPLSSVDIDTKGVVREAMKLLKRLIAGEAPPDNPILIPPKGIVTRRSSDLLAVSDPRVARAVQFMWDHLNWPLTVEDVALEVGVSRRTLDQAFLKNLGRGINAELRRKRLERCAELLRSTSVTFNEIFKSVGFRSKPYAHKIFRQTYGMPPTEYRKTH